MLSETFHNLKIIELTSVLAGPAAGMFFAELGAEVIKVENKTTGGDVTRNWKLSLEDEHSKTSAYYHSVNWGKQSVFLDLTDTKDRRELNDLLTDAVGCGCQGVHSCHFINQKRWYREIILSVKIPVLYLPLPTLLQVLH